VTIRKGSIIRVDTATKKGRPGVVVDTLPDGQVVVLGERGRFARTSATSPSRRASPRAARSG
jgi:hypothetical protein